MNISDTLSLTDFFKLIDEVLGKRKHVQELIDYYQNHLDKLRLWGDELDQAIIKFNQLETVPIEYINVQYLKQVIKKPLPKVETVLTETQYFESTLKAMNSFEFFDKIWKIESLAGACTIAFYRTFILVSQPYLKEKKAQVASAIEECLALMRLDGHKTELFESVRHWIIDWQNQGFSVELAEKVKKNS